MSDSTTFLGSRVARFRAQMKYLPRTFALVWQAARKWTICWVVLSVVEGLLPVLLVYLTRFLVDSIVFWANHRQDDDELLRVLVAGAMIAGVMIVTRVLRSARSWTGEAQADLLRDHISGLIHAKSVEADLQFYDSPEFYDHLHRAREEARYRPVQLLDNLGSLLQNGITLIAMIGILIPYGPLLPLALFASTLPALYLVIRSGRLRHRLAHESTIDERRAWYLDWLLTGAETAQEVRLFKLGTYFQDSFRRVRQNLRQRKLRLAIHQTVWEILTGTLSLLLAGIALLDVLLQTMKGRFSLGDLALFYQAFNQGMSLSQSLLTNVGQLYENTLFLGNLYEFLDFEPQVKDLASPQIAGAALHSGIRFRDVSFRYPGSERLVLQNLNMTIPAGKIVAIVGPNGSGKSTLVKLLCRFYDPQQGTVEFDEVSLGQISRDSLRERISVLFQTPVRYNASAAENIAYGRLGAEATVELAAEDAGAATIISALPKGYETHLGRWLSDGVELSVGEWQRVALARALYRNAPILVLDEPTSAMDPWTELEWARRFREIAAGRTAIVITHRFTTAMFSDRIFVMQDGQVREEGSHEELLATGGFYAAGWEACGAKTTFTS